MGTVSTFGTYSLARLGIYAAQNSITITGNNISNVNTKGYTRQAPDQISLNSGGADRYQSPYNMKIGNGSLVKNVTQLRDQYLDLRYRDANADVGSVDATLAIQMQLASILDEVGGGPEESGVLEAYFSAMEEQLQNMITQGTGDDRYETLFRSAANTLATQLRSYAGQLRDLEEKTAEQFQTEVDKVNVILTEIRDLNIQIRKSQIFGSNPLELLDARNVLIDELSYYMDIRVSIEQEDIGNNEYVDRLVITTVPTDGNMEEQELIYGVYGAQLSVKNEEGTPYEGTYALAVSALKNIRGSTLRDTKTTTETLTLDDIIQTLKDQLGLPDGDVTLTYNAEAAAGEEYTLSLADGTTQTLSADQVLDALKAAYPESEPATVPGGGMTSATSYSFTQNEDGSFTMTETVRTTSEEYVFQDAELFGALQSQREMLTERGSFWMELGGGDAENAEAEAYLKADPNGDVKRGIPYYRKMLDLFASNFAAMMNDANDKAGGGVLFSNSGDGNDPDGIDASNISISQGWANGSVYVVHGDHADGELSTDSTNLLRILGILQSEDHEFTVKKPVLDENGDPVPETDEAGNPVVDEDGNPVYQYKEERIFKGSFQQLFTNHTVGNLATDISTNNTRLDNYESVLEEVYVERDGVMGVYLDDEAMDMMKYQQAYNAACRLMTTFDEMIDKLVNGM